MKDEKEKELERLGFIEWEKGSRDTGSKGDTMGDGAM